MDLQDTIVYLVLQLRNGGYEVRYTYPNLLWISWKHHETDYLTKANPIIQAMVPEKPKPQLPLPSHVSKPKKQQPKLNTTVSFNDDVSLINGIQPPNSYTNFGTPPGLSYNYGAKSVPPRKAADYQPPESFLQTMDKPVKPKVGNNKTSILEDLWNV